MYLWLLAVLFLLLARGGGWLTVPSARRCKAKIRGSEKAGTGVSASSVVGCSGAVIWAGCSSSCHLQLDFASVPWVAERDLCCSSCIIPAFLKRGAWLSTQSQSLFLWTFADVSASSLCAGWPKGSWTSLYRRKRVTGGRGWPSKRSARSSWHPISTAGWTSRMLKWSWRRRSVPWAPGACAASYKARTAVLLCLNLHSSFSSLACWLLLLFYAELVEWFIL